MTSWLDGPVPRPREERLAVARTGNDERDGHSHGAGDSDGDANRAPRPSESASWVVRTAICVEPR